MSGACGRYGKDGKRLKHLVVYIYIYILLLTASGYVPGGSGTTIHNTQKNTK